MIFDNRRSVEGNIWGQTTGRISKPDSCDSPSNCAGATGKDSERFALDQCGGNIETDQ